MKLTLMINDNQTQVEGMENLRLVLDRLGHVGHGLCHHEKLISQARCDLCLVKVDGELIRSCQYFINRDIEVQTDDQDLKQARIESFNLLVKNHKTDCEKCHQSGLCKIQNFARTNILDLNSKELFNENSDYEVITRDYRLDHDRCTQCSLCVEYSQKIEQDGLFYHSGRGSNSRVAFNQTVLETTDLAVYRDLCPTGAIAHKDDYRHGERGPWQMVTCTGCERECQAQARTVNKQFVDFRMPSENIGLSCEAGVRWWHSLDLARPSYKFLAKLGEDLMAPKNAAEIGEIINKNMSWHILLPGDLAPEEALQWSEVLKLPNFTASYLKPSSDDFKVMIGPMNVLERRHECLGELQVSAMSEGFYGGLIVVEPLWLLKTSVLAKLTQNADHCVVFRHGPIIEELNIIQVERFPWSYSSLLPTRQKGSVQGIINTLINAEN